MLFAVFWEVFGCFGDWSLSFLSIYKLLNTTIIVNGYTLGHEIASGLFG